MSAGALQALQSALQDFMLQGTADVLHQINGTSRVPAGTRLGIYADAYRARLTEGLESNFPVLAKLMGTVDFHRLARRYIEGHESLHRSIRRYGDHLAAFLSEDVNYRDAPVLADLAAFEWAMAEVFDAADADVMTPEELRGRMPDEWADMRLVVHPSVRCIPLQWNAPQIWTAIQKDGTVREAHCEPTPLCWLLWRQELQIFFRPLDPVEAAALEALLDERSFGELCRELCERVGETEAPLRAASLVRGWIESGVIRTGVSE